MNWSISSVGGRLLEWFICDQRFRTRERMRRLRGGAGLSNQLVLLLDLESLVTFMSALLSLRS